jgi:hypothetical protein
MMDRRHRPSDARATTHDAGGLTMIRLTSMWLVASMLAGCGGFYWQQAGRGQADFERESSVCAVEAQRAPRDADMEKVYRACMQAKGWQRAQVHTPVPGQFRGPESDEEMARPPSATRAVGEDPAAASCRASTNWNQDRLTATTEYHQCLRRR